MSKGSLSWKRILDVVRGTEVGEPSLLSTMLYRDIGRKSLMPAGSSTGAYRFPSPGSQGSPGLRENFPEKAEAMSSQYYGLNRRQIMELEAKAEGELMGPVHAVDRAPTPKVPQNFAEFKNHEVPGLAVRWGKQMRTDSTYTRM